jgi:N-acetylglucosamine-6-phosphate deacetylase
LNILLVHNASLIIPEGEWQPGWLMTAGKTIRMMGAGDPPQFEASQAAVQIDAGGKLLLPGFIDLHVHGAVGSDVMDANPDGLHAMARFYATHGVTAFLPTCWSASRGAILAALEAVGEVVGYVPGGATILGAHLEGPYLNPQKCGAQNDRYIRRAGTAEALEFLDTGLVRLLTLAPEFEENLWLVEECALQGITVSIGHTTAGYEQVLRAVKRGASHVTHCYNAMTGFGHRGPGTVGAAMAIPELCCELIADDIHVHPVAQKILLDVKGTEGVVLVTDAVRAAGLPDGEYALDERKVEVRDGAVRLADGTLAGSSLTMERALANIQRATGRPLKELWRLTSLNAARQIGVSGAKGSLEVGKDADLVLLDADFNVHLTVVGGNIVYRRVEKN